MTYGGNGTTQTNWFSTDLTERAIQLLLDQERPLNIKPVKFYTIYLQFLNLQM